MICKVCECKINKKLIEPDSRTCYSCILNLEQRIEEFKTVSDYESNY